MAVPRLTRNAPGPDVPQRARPVPEAGSRSRLAIVAPADDATVAGPLVFTWRPTNADTYRIVLLTDDGAPVWTKDTGDTIATLPDSVTLAADRAYFWQVEAIGNGIDVTTAFHRLQTPRK